MTVGHLIYECVSADMIAYESVQMCGSTASSTVTAVSSTSSIAHPVVLQHSPSLQPASVWVSNHISVPHAGSTFSAFPDMLNNNVLISMPGQDCLGSSSGARGEPGGQSGV